jgi:hypothetical protein
MNSATSNLSSPSQQHPIKFANRSLLSCPTVLASSYNPIETHQSKPKPTHTHTDTYIYMCIHTYVYIYRCVYTNTYIHKYTHTYIYYVYIYIENAQISLENELE